MNTVNSDQVVGIWNQVGKVVVIVVHEQGCLTGVRDVAIHVTTAEAKPKEDRNVFY